MKKSSLLMCFIVLSVFIFTKCSKDDAPVTPPAATDFSPLNPGSSWTYKYTENLVSDTAKFTVTANSKDFNGRSYKILTTNSGDSSYFTKSGNDYYRLQEFPALGIKPFEELYLKDNQEVNGTWSSTTSINYMGFPVPVTLNDTIKGKGETRTVLGKAYTDVTHVKLGISASILGSVSKIGNADFYYSKGVGMIDAQIAAKSPIGPETYSSKQELISSEIK